MTPIENVLSRLKGTRQAGSGWSARCPAHDDKSPSLSIREWDDGRVLLCCHAGCTTADVAAAMGLKLADLMPTNGAARRQAPRPPAPTKSTKTYATHELALVAYRLGEPTRIWVYDNAAGDLVGAVGRWDGPNGKQVRPVALTPKGWTCAAMLAPRVLYNLPVVRESDGTIWVHEGESCADAGMALGLVSTTSAGGSKAASKSDWSPLAGRECVLLPDCDDAGEQYAADVTRLLSELNPPATVRILRLPGLSAGGDIVDFLEANPGTTADDLRRLAEAVPVEALDAPAAETAEPPEPIPDWQPFPVECLPNVFRSFCEASSETMRVDPTFLALPLLATAAGSIGNTTRVRVRSDWFEPAILWAALVAESGTLKTPCLRSVLRPIYERQREALVAHDREMAAYAAAQEVYKADAAAWKKDRMGEQPKPPTPPVMERFVVSDCTVEALATVLQHTPRGVLLHRDELSGWIGSFDQYKMTKGSDASHWLSMHSAESMQVDRKGSGYTFVSRAAVSIIGGTQPGTLQRAITAEHRESGLLARLLVTMPPRMPKRWTERSIPEAVSRAVGEVFVDLLNLQPDNPEPWKPRVLDLAPDARQVFATFYNEHAKAMAHETGDIAAAMSKLEGTCPRLALILHLVKVAGGEHTEHVGKVDAPTMRQAVTITRWFVAETMRVYRVLSESEADRVGRELVTWIRQRGGEVTVRDLAYSGPRHFRGDNDAAQKALDLLRIDGLGVWEWCAPGPRGGRSTQVFRLKSPEAGCATPVFNAVASGSASASTSNTAKNADADPSVEDPIFGPNIAHEHPVDDDLSPPEIRFADADEAAAEIDANPWGVMAERDANGETATERAERYRRERAQ